MTNKVAHNKCARRQDHDTKDNEIFRTRTHIVKECRKCKGKFYLARRT